MATNGNLRLIQIGLGIWGRDWVSLVIRGMPGLEPVAWVDNDPVARKLAITELGLPVERVHASVAAAVAHSAADAALIVVPTAAHATAAKEAIGHGLHVLIEKPFTETLEEARSVLASGTGHGLRVMVNQNYRWFRAPRLARRLVREGAIGRPVAAYLDFHRFYGPTYRYFGLAQPLLSDMAIHHFDGLRFVMDDEPSEVSCLSWSEPGLPFAGPPAAIAAIRMQSGALVSYRASWISRGPETPFGGMWRLDGTEGRIDFQFRGAAEHRDTMDKLSWHRQDSAIPVSLPELADTDRRGSLAAFARWVRETSTPEGASTGEDNLRSLALMHAAVLSAAADGAWVRIADVLTKDGS